MIHNTKIYAYVYLRFANADVIAYLINVKPLIEIKLNMDSTKILREHQNLDLSLYKPYVRQFKMYSFDLFEENDDKLFKKPKLPNPDFVSP